MVKLLSTDEPLCHIACSGNFNVLVNESHHMLQTPVRCMHTTDNALRVRVLVTVNEATCIIIIVSMEFLVRLLH